MKYDGLFNSTNNPFAHYYLFNVANLQKNHKRF